MTKPTLDETANRLALANQRIRHLEQDLAQARIRLENMTRNAEKWRVAALVNEASMKQYRDALNLLAMDDQAIEDDILQGRTVQ